MTINEIIVMVETTSFDDKSEIENIERLLELPELESFEPALIEAEASDLDSQQLRDEFQTYVDSRTNDPIKKGTTIGFEYMDAFGSSYLIMFKNVAYSEC